MASSALPCSYLVRNESLNNTYRYLQLQYLMNSCNGAEMDIRRAVRGRPKGNVLQSVFLDHLRKSANVSDAARAAGIDRKTAYNWRHGDELFCEKWKQALEEATDLLEAEARRRAIHGYEEPLLYGGRLVCDAEGNPVTRTRYSDGLLRMLLRAHRPSSFRDAPTKGDGPEPELTLGEGDDTL